MVNRDHHPASRINAGYLRTARPAVIASERKVQELHGVLIVATILIMLG